MTIIGQQNQSNLKVIQGSTATFMDVVIKESSNKLVVVFIMVPESKECKTMQGIIEKVLGTSQDKTQMVLIDYRKETELVSQIGVSSVPTVLMFKDGKPLGAFEGLQSEENIIKVFSKIVKIDAETKNLFEDALKYYQKMDMENALSIYSQILEKEPENIKAILGAFNCYIFLGYLSAEIFESVPENLKSDTNIQLLQESFLKLESLKNTEHKNDIEEILKGNLDIALSNLLNSVINNKDKENAKNIIFATINLMGKDHELSNKYRRKLTTALFV